MSEQLDLKREGYRERLSEGDVGYIVEGPSPYNPSVGALTVKKVTVTDTHYEGHRRHYPFITRWEDVQQKPNTTGLLTSLSPRAIFTPLEVQRVINNEDGLLGVDARQIDEIITDTAAMPLLAEALGAAVMKRMADASLARPHDPEY